jgi:Methyltransferase domain
MSPPSDPSVPGALAFSHSVSPICLPPLVADVASLSPLEKSLLGHFLLLSRPRVIVEIGVYRAVTTGFIMEFLRLNGLEAQVVGFDRPEMCEQLSRENADVQRWLAEGRLRLVSGELPFSLREWTEREKPVIDLALVDARHDFPSVDWELKLLYPCLAPGGYILGHDYSALFEGVRYAFDHFAARHGAMLMPLESGWPEGESGRGSVLVALRRPTYKQNLRTWCHHHWQGLKADLVRGRLSGALWRALRGFFRSGK